MVSFSKIITHETLSAIVVAEKTKLAESSRKICFILNFIVLVNKK
jgi:hypothetical protein